MKFLVVGQSWLGDAVLSQILFTAIKEQNANAIIDVIAPFSNAPLIRRMPQVRRVLSEHHQRLNMIQCWKLGRRLAQEHYHQAIVLPTAFKYALIPFAARIPVRTGFSEEIRDGLLNDIRKKPHLPNAPLVHEYLILIRSKENVDQPYTPPHLQKMNPQHMQQLRQEFALQCTRPILGLGIGAARPTKRWPARHYAAIATRYIETHGWQIWIFGNKNERMLASELKSYMKTEHLDKVYDLTGKTLLNQLIDLISMTNAMLANDTSFMHIAAAFSLPTAAIYGPTLPESAPPLTQKNAIISLRLPCSPCTRIRSQKCPLQHWDCLNQLSPQHVLHFLEPLTHTSSAS